MNDQCKHCTLCGHLKECLAEKCEMRDTWAFCEVKKQRDELLKIVERLLDYTLMPDSKADTEFKTMDLIRNLK